MRPHASRKCANGGRIKISPDHPGRRAGFLDLCNESNRTRASHGSSKVAWGHRVRRLPLKGVKRELLPGRCHFESLRLNDFIEY